MSEIFLKIINMSISASYIVIAVLLLRLLLKKAPKWIIVVLWGVVAVRLVCPFSIESVLSLIPSTETVSSDIMMDRTPEINTGIPIVNQVINPVIGGSFSPDPGTSANLLQLWIPTFAAIWIVGMVALFIYTVISCAKMKRRIGTAILLRDNIYQSENVVSPFVLGLIKPKIYLPFNMNEKDMEYVVAHEMAHIRRKDHLWKPFGFILLTLHWFNPLMWLGYVLLCRDIEFACDEKVIKELDHDARADYSKALLTCSVNRRMIAACPLAFGEVSVKDRVKSVLNYKKPAFWIIIAAVIACVAVSVCFLTDPPYKEKKPTEEIVTEDENGSTFHTELLRQTYPEYFGLDTSDGLDVYVWQITPDSYLFSLLPHSEDSNEVTTIELMKLKDVRTNDMREILSTYDVDTDDVYIIPWQNPISNYIASYWIMIEGKDFEAQRREYVDHIRQMLFSTQDNPSDSSSTDDKKEAVESQGLTFISSVDNTCYLSGIGSCEDTKVVIPCRSPVGEIVVGIGPNAFEGCDRLAEVIIPEGVEFIDNRAFYGCSRLESVVIPNSVKIIGYGAFEKCVNLESASMTGVEYMDGNAFSACEKLRKVDMGDKVSIIKSHTFYACRSLEEIVIPDSVSIIGYGVFKDCDSLTEVIIPKGVTSIGEMVFESCDKMNSVAFENVNGWSIGGEHINVEDQSKNVEYLTSWSGEWYCK